MPRRNRLPSGFDEASPYVTMMLRPRLRHRRAKPVAPSRAARRKIGRAGIRWLGMWWFLAAVAAAPALAQDVPGIELCSKEASMERRTGCLQSNVEFLQKVITRNALDTQQKLVAAGREITTLKDQLAAAGRESAALKEKLAAIDARIGRLEKPAPQRPDTRPEAKPETKSEPKPDK